MKERKKSLRIFLGLHKKGSGLVDLMIILAILLVVGISSLIAYSILDNINTEIQADTSFNNQSKEILSDSTTRFPALFDGLFIFIFIMLFVSLLISSYFIDTNPIYFIVMVIMLIFACVFGVMLSNVYDDFTADPELASYQTTFPMTNWLLDNLLIVTLIMGFSTVVVLFAKNRLG